MKANISGFDSAQRKGFTLIELLVVIAIIAILAVVVVLTLNPAELLRQSRDANRVSDMATLTSALSLYLTDQAGASTFNLGSTASTGISVYDPNGSSTCGSLGLPSLGSSTWYCGTSTSSRSVGGSGWIPVNLTAISAGTPIGSLPVDPTNQTSSGLFYSYNTNGTQFEATANLESSKYKTQYGNNPQTPNFPEVISGGTQGISALYSNTGLVGYWPLNEGTGSSTIDQSGNGNGGTWSGTPAGNGGTYYAAGKVGSYAGYFNGNTGNDSVVTNGTVGALTSNFTVVAWINNPSFSSVGDFTVVGDRLNAASGWEIETPTSGNSAALLWRTFYGSSGNIYSAYMLNSGTWYQVAAVQLNGSALLYVNGAQVLSQSITNPVAGSQAFAIGYIGVGSGGSSWLGSIDDVRIYNRTLSAAEIQALYNAEK